MIKLQIHTVKDTVTACLLFVAVCAPLGVVRIITPELPVNPEKPDVPLNKNDAFQKVQKRRVQEKR